MANKWDLTTVTWSCTGGASSSQNIGGLIPAGRTRFLCYLRIEESRILSAGLTTSGASWTVGSCALTAVSHGDCSAGALYNMKLWAYERSTTGAMQKTPRNTYLGYFPRNPGQIEHPIVSMAGGTSAFMIISRSNAGCSAQCFAQYYDE